MNDPNQWVSQGAGSITVSGTDGTTLGTGRVAFGLAAGQVGWVIPNDASVSGNGSRIGTSDLNIGSLAWAPARGPAQYDGKVEIELSGHTSKPSEYEAAQDRYIHEIAVEIRNGSDLQMRRATLFGIILDSAGNTVGITNYSTRQDINFGQNATFEVRSIGRGLCSGQRDVGDTYEIRYWVDFRTPDNETLTYYGVATTKSSQIVDDAGSFYAR